MIGPRTAGSRAVLGLTLALVAGPWLAPVPAQAQVGAFFDSLFGRKEEPAPEPEPGSPAPAASAAKKAAPKVGKESGKDAASNPKAASTDKPATADKGGTKPGARGAEKATNAKLPEAKVAAVGSPVAPAAPESVDAAAVLAQANAYFNGMTTLTGSFMQIAADGRRIGGKLTLAKPGRLRFDYDQPSPLEVVADGTSVAVRDRKLATQDLYFIAQTPLKFLLREKIDLARDLTVTDVTNDPGGVRISLEDRATLGGTSKIQLFFDADVKTLSQWRITDPQGYLTTVQLTNLQKGRSVDGNQFFINYGRAEDKAAQQQIQQSQRP